MTIHVQIEGAIDSEDLLEALKRCMSQDVVALAINRASRQAREIIYGGQARPPMAYRRMPYRFDRPEGWSPYGDRFG